MFEASQAVVGLKEGLSVENLKKFQKDAKLWVRENVQGQENYGKIDIENQGQSHIDGGSKRKMSPRSSQRVQKIVNTRIRHTRQDIITGDDFKAIKKLIDILRDCRGSGKEQLYNFGNKSEFDK